MGTLRYAGTHSFDMPDNVLVHFDAALQDVAGRSFQVHIPLGGENDFDLVALSIGPGIPLVIQFANGPHIDIDYSLVAEASEQIVSRGQITLPGAFHRDGGVVNV